MAEGTFAIPRSNRILNEIRVLYRTVGLDEWMLIIATAVFGLTLLIPTLYGHASNHDRYIFAAVLLFSFVLYPRRYLLPWKLLAWLLAFFIPLLIGYLIHYDSVPYWAKVIQKYFKQGTTALLVLTFYWVNVRTWRAAKMVMITLIVTAAISDILRMAGALGLVGANAFVIRGGASMRLELGTDYNTSTAYTFATVAYFGVFIHSARSRWNRAFTYTFIALTFITAGLAASRSGLLALGLLLMTVLSLSLRHTSKAAKREAILILLFITIISIIAFTFYYAYFATIIRHFAHVIGERSANVRVIALKFLFSQFFTGIHLTGPGLIPYAKIFGDFHCIDPHNVVAGLFSIGGQPLAIVFVFFWFEAFINAFRLAISPSSKYQPWGVFLMGMLVGEFFIMNSNPHFFSKLFWLTPAIAIKLPYLRDLTIEPEPQARLSLNHPGDS